MFRYRNEHFSCYLLGIVAQIVNIVWPYCFRLHRQRDNNGSAFNLAGLLNSYIVAFVVGLIATIDMWKIIPAKTAKKIIYIFTFPIYMMTYLPHFRCCDIQQGKLGSDGS